MSSVQTGFRRVPGADQGAWRAVRQRFYRVRHDVIDIGRRYADRWPLALGLLLIQAATLTFVWWQTHADSSFRAVAIVGAGIFAGNGLLMLELNMRRTDALAQSKSRRKIQTGDIIDQLAARLPKAIVTEPELRAMQVEILQTVASCVSSVFALDPVSCMASLLVWSADAPGERLVVIARAWPGRQPGGEYPKHGMLAYYAMDEKRVAVTGEVDKEYDGFKDKSYKSVISFPVIAEGKAIGAISVDHKLRFLFDKRQDVFRTMVHPYVRMMAMTFTNIEASKKEAA